MTYGIVVFATVEGEGCFARESENGGNHFGDFHSRHGPGTFPKRIVGVERGYAAHVEAY